MLATTRSSTVLGVEGHRVRVEVLSWKPHPPWPTPSGTHLPSPPHFRSKAMEHKAWKDHKTWLAAERKRAEIDAWADHQLWMDDHRVRVEAERWAGQ